MKYFANILNAKVNGAYEVHVDDTFKFKLEDAITELAAIIKNGFEHEFVHTIYFDGKQIQIIDILQEARLLVDEDIRPTDLESFHDLQKELGVAHA